MEKYINFVAINLCIQTNSIHNLNILRKRYNKLQFVLLSFQIVHIFKKINPFDFSHKGLINV